MPELIIIDPYEVSCLFHNRPPSVWTEAASVHELFFRVSLFPLRGEVYLGESPIDIPEAFIYLGLRIPNAEGRTTRRGSDLREQLKRPSYFAIFEKAAIQTARTALTLKR